MSERPSSQIDPEDAPGIDSLDYGMPEAGDQPDLEGQLEAPLGDDCSIIGVTRVGKTFLLAALHQACLLSGADGYRLTFVVRDENDLSKVWKTSDLLRDAVDRIINGDSFKLAGTNRVDSYAFQVSCRASALREPGWLAANLWRLGRTLLRSANASRSRAVWQGTNHDITFELLDGPGEAQFPTEGAVKPEMQEYRAALIRHLRKARRLVICVDALSPSLPTFQKGFPSLVGAAADPITGRLNADRVLLLLTKIDANVDLFLNSARASLARLKGTALPTTALRLVANQQLVTARGLAQSLDPVEMARTVLSQATVSMIRRSLRDNAQMAIGVCSSTGFYSDGTTFWRGDVEGVRSRPGQTGDDAYRNWIPFGVKEAVLYLATGRCGPLICNYNWREDLAASNRQSFQIKLSNDERIGIDQSFQAAKGA